MIMSDNILELDGQKSGPTSLILAGVHGNEKCGVEALKKLLPLLKIERGRVLIATGNPAALARGVRYLEVDLNRMFQPRAALTAREIKSREYERAQVLKKYLNKSDALLDIHASLTPGSRPFVIGEANAKKIIKYLPINLVVSGFDSVEPGGTDYYMNSRGKIGLCVECGYLADHKALRIAEKSIIAFLKARGHITNNLVPRHQSHLRLYERYLTRTRKFTLPKKFADFEKIARGQLIGFDGREEVRAKKSSLILFARNRTAIGAEAFLLGVKKKSLI